MLYFFKKSNKRKTVPKSAHDKVLAAKDRQIKTKDKQIVDEDYRTVARAYLDATDEPTLARALEAAKACVTDDPSDAETVDKMVAVFNRSGSPGKLAVISVLWNLKKWYENAPVSALFEQSLASDDTYLVSSALFRWESGIFSATDRERVMGTAKGLLTHTDAGIRGRSINVLTRGARSAEEKEEYGTLIEKMLDDKHPFVRSIAARAMGSMKRTSALPRMMELLDDTEKNTYDIKGFKKLDGTNGSVHHDGSAWSRVDDAVLSSIKAMSWSIKPKFEYDINYKTKDKDMAKAVKDAKSWYDKVKGDL